ncbi:MAG TPA: PQQ-dependent sugar dehydrogenase, partial [Pyrinomonadaceae bacterium]|nr:PQQ-dependent sugar dehydrogenase [Pyrinomonadaceae bacterium]
MVVSPTNSRVLVLIGAIVFCYIAFGSATARRTRAPNQPDGEGEFHILALASPVAGFSFPLAITNANDGSGRIFITEQAGRIRIIKNGALVANPFLDISARVTFAGERGLLGLAFPPGYTTKGYFYVDYINSVGNIVIARYRRSASDPDAADPASEQVVLTIAQSSTAHKGGQLAFGPDGFLYVSTGDDDKEGDPENHAQNAGLLAGKILRIDVETGSPQTYTVPASNPFVGQPAYRPEIWALGLRNPWRFSFDRQTGDLYVGDVGQDFFEEVDFQTAGSSGGQNYGWRLMEGLHCYNPSTCDSTGLTAPIIEYDHSAGCAVMGGYVYRGSKFPSMQGLYFYGDFCSGRVWSIRQQNGSWQTTSLLESGLHVSAFGEDEAGELYMADYGAGKIYALTEAGASPTPTPTPSSTPTPSPNPIDGSEFFVRQHYLDFLNREPDPDGLKFWTSGIDACNDNAFCVQAKRVNTSAAFFLSIEFQETAYLVERFYKTAFGDINPPAVP